MQEIRAHLRLRFAEWTLALAIFMWGLFVHLNPEALTGSPNFVGLLEMAGPTTWSIFAMCVGVIRLIFLVINGTYQQSAHIRAVGAALGFGFWTTVLFAYTLTGDLMPNFASIGALAILDLYSCWWAADDAKNADKRSRYDKAELKRLRQLTGSKEV